MNKYRSSAELKSLAKEKLSGKYSTVIIAIFMIQCLQFLITSMLPVDGLVWTILSFIITAIISVIMGIFQTGLSFLFLNIACDAPYSSADIYYGFRFHPEKSIRISLAHVGLELVTLTPYQIFMVMYLETQSMIWFSLTMITLAVGLVIYVPVSLAISQSYYLLLDFPEYEAGQILKTSCKIMKGNMARLFYVQASFIPLLILGSLSFGIGLLWVMPYMNMTFALFFLDLMNPTKKDSE